MPKDEHEMDIDELEEDWEDGSDYDDPNAFKIRGALVAPTARMLTARQLHSLIHEGMINLSPPYQRDEVWPESKQIHLIDSMFRNFYIPPIIFAVQKDEDGEEVRVCVDGKQRLTSIQKFFDGQIPLGKLDKDARTKKSYWFTRPESSKHAKLEIPEEYKKRFAEKTLTCVEYHGILPGTEREIFQRVQLGMTLTGAEKLQAVASPWTDWVNDLELRHVANEGGLTKVLQWDTKRGRDFQCLAQFIYCCDGLPSHLIPTHQKMERWLTRMDIPAHSFKVAINSVLDDFYYIATDKRLSSGFTKINKKLAPVEFVFIGVLLYTLRHAADEDRARAVYNMRAHVRKEHIDIRYNTTVGKTLWNFIATVSGNPSGSHAVTAGVSQKRKRKTKVDDDEESGDEYRPGYGVATTKSRSTKAGRSY